MNGYDDYEEYEPDWRTLRQSTHTARTPHHCDTCDCLIQPGQRYQIMVALDEGEFKIWRNHIMGECQFREPPPPPVYDYGPDEVPF